MTTIQACSPPTRPKAYMASDYLSSGFVLRRLSSTPAWASSASPPDEANPGKTAAAILPAAQTSS